MMPIKFEESLIEKVKSGEKDTTWRIWEEKDVSPDQEVSLQDTEGNEFAKARILWVKDTRFSRLTEEDKRGHDSYSSRKEMYETYEGYYNQDVGPDTEVKVIKFELLQD